METEHLNLKRRRNLIPNTGLLILCPGHLYSLIITYDYETYVYILVENVIYIQI